MRMVHHEARVGLMAMVRHKKKKALLTSGTPRRQGELVVHHAQAMAKGKGTEECNPAWSSKVKNDQYSVKHGRRQIRPFTGANHTTKTTSNDAPKITDYFVLFLSFANP